MHNEGKERLEVYLKKLYIGVGAMVLVMPFLFFLFFFFLV